MDTRTVSRRLISLRGAKTREEVAKDLGISNSALAMYENAHRVPRDDIKVRLAEYYGSSVGAIFFGE